MRVGIAVQRNRRGGVTVAGPDRDNDLLPGEPFVSFVDEPVAVVVHTIGCRRLLGHAVILTPAKDDVIQGVVGGGEHFRDAERAVEILPPSHRGDGDAVDSGPQGRQRCTARQGQRIVRRNRGRNVLDRVGAGIGPSGGARDSDLLAYVESVVAPASSIAGDSMVGIVERETRITSQCRLSRGDKAIESPVVALEEVAEAVEYYRA